MQRNRPEDVQEKQTKLKNTKKKNENRKADRNPVRKQTETHTKETKA